jgi:hypothetical protein
VFTSSPAGTHIITGFNPVQDMIELLLAQFAGGELMQWRGSQIKLSMAIAAVARLSNGPACQSLRHATVECIRSTWTGYRMATFIQRMFFCLKGRPRIVTCYNKLAATFVVGELPCRCPYPVDLVQSDRSRWCSARCSYQRVHNPALKLRR